MTQTSVNPTNATTIADYEELRPDRLGELVTRTAAAARSWGGLGFEQRAVYLEAAARTLRDRTRRYAELMALEMGKPLREGRAEVEKCAWVCEYYAEGAASMLAPESIETEATRSYVKFEPLGVVLSIMPWNFPFWQLFRFGAPALMAGNAILLKHAPNVPGCAMAIQQLFDDVELPAGLFRTLLLDVEHVPDLIEHPEVSAVTFTGSTAAGRTVARLAGGMLKKVVLELGGNDPYVILEDADLDRAVEICATSRLLNGGQSCIAAKRFIVPRPIRREFEERLLERMGRVELGDPLDESTQIGPLAREDLRDHLHRQVIESISSGARCALGGSIPDGPGFFYPPTLLTDVGPGMPAYEEELFGPVAAVVPVENEEQAIEVANDTEYGLGACVLTSDVARGEAIAAGRLQAGCCFVNDFVKSDPRLPFGGIKRSGYGRELGVYGIKEFVNIKTVCVK